MFVQQVHYTVALHKVNWTIVKRQNSIFPILQAVKSTGLLTSDPRLRDCMEKIRKAVQESAGEVMMDRELFRKWVFGEVRQYRKGIFGSLLIARISNIATGVWVAT